MKFLKGLGLFALALCFNCASTTSVLSEFDESADFDNYKTYVLCIDDLFVDNTKYPKLDNNYVRELIGAEIEEQMESQGYKTNVLRPELQAGFKISISEEKSTITNCEIHDEMDYWKTCTINTEVYTKETLILYVSDIERNQVIWQATAPSKLNKSKTALIDYIKELVSQLFDEFPKING